MSIGESPTPYNPVRSFLAVILILAAGTHLHAQVTGSPATPANAASVRPVLVGVEFDGNEGLSDDYLAAQIRTRATVSSFIRRFFGVFTDLPISTTRHRDALRGLVDSLTGEIRYLNMTSVASDTGRLRLVYENLGYHRAEFDFKIRLDTAGNRAIVRYLIKEGPRSTLNGITYIGSENLPQVIRTAMAAPEEFELREEFSRELMNLEVARIVELLKNNGYAFAAVNNIVVLKLDTPTVAKPYDSALVSIYYGNRYRFGQTAYVPDTVTDIRNVEEVAVRRQIEYRQGEWYSEEKLEQTVANLYSVLGTFELVRLDTMSSTSTEDTLGMRLSVKLRKPRDIRVTPELSFERRQKDYVASVGVGTEFSMANLFGQAERVSAQARIASRLQKFDYKEFQIGAGLTYYEPTFLGFDRVSFSLSASGDDAIEDRILRDNIDDDIVLRSLRVAPVSATFTWRQPKYTFLTAITGQIIGQRIAYSNVGAYVAGKADELINRFPKFITPQVVQRVNTAMQQRIYRTQILQGDSLELAQAIYPDAAQYFDQLKYSAILRSTFTTDRRNSFFAPTEGHFGNGTVELGGWVSGIGWGKGELDARIYRPVFDLSTFAGRLHLGGIIPFGPITFVPLQSLFWAGGANSIRGWGPREMLAPIEIVQADSANAELFDAIQREGRRFQGGLILVEFMAELRTRLFVLQGRSGLAQQLNNFSLILFLDAGNAYYRNYREDPAFNMLENTGLATGMSIGYDTPIGPFRFGFGVPIWDPIKYGAGKRLVFSQHPLLISDFAWHVSIGHAF